MYRVKTSTGQESGFFKNRANANEAWNSYVRFYVTTGQTRVSCWLEWWDENAGVWVSVWT